MGMWKPPYESKYYIWPFCYSHTERYRPELFNSFTFSEICRCSIGFTCSHLISVREVGSPVSGSDSISGQSEINKSSRDGRVCNSFGRDCSFVQPQNVRILRTVSLRNNSGSSPSNITSSTELWIWSLWMNASAFLGKKFKQRSVINP